MTPLPQASISLWIGFVGLSLAMATLVIHLAERVGDEASGKRTARFFGLWLLGTAGLGASGMLAHFDPPRLPALLLAIIGLLVFTARSAWGARLTTLPVRWLVGFQSFRIVVELLIHQAAEEQIAPYVLTWEGANLDIVSGVSALLLAPFADRVSRTWLLVWNTVAAFILVVVIVTAVLAMPGPLQVLDTTPPNVWVAAFPYVWLPSVLVLIAFGGHLVLYRKLLQDDGEAAEAG